MTKVDKVQNEKRVVQDLGDATENTKGYNFDYVDERIPLDKRYNRTTPWP